MTLYFLIFIVSSFLLVSFAKLLIDSSLQIGRFLGCKEFVVAFFTVSLGAVAPEFFIGISSALNNVPELSFGNIVGQNILLFSLTVGICAIILKNGIEVESRTVRAGATFAVTAAILPLVLILNGELSRIDGVVLLLFFCFFFYWLFSKKERFTKVYDIERECDKKKKRSFLKNLIIFLIGFIIIILSSQGIVTSAKYFSEVIPLSLPVIGILIVAIGVGLPETYFAVTLAKKGQSWMILGGLMGAVAISSTLVLGVVALINPIVIDVSEITSLYIARIFLILCALIFLFFIRTERRISTREGIFLIITYIVFVTLEILIK